VPETANEQAARLLAKGPLAAVADGKRQQLVKAELRAQDVLEAIPPPGNRDVRRLWNREERQHGRLDELSEEEASMLAG
jgi:hypothetical protein